MPGFEAGNVFGGKLNVEEGAWARSASPAGADSQPTANLSASLGGLSSTYRTFVQKLLSQFVPPATATSGRLTITSGDLGKTEKEAAVTGTAGGTEKASARSDVLAFVAGIGFILLAWGALVLLRMVL